MLERVLHEKLRGRGVIERVLAVLAFRQASCIQGYCYRSCSYSYSHSSGVVTILVVVRTCFCVSGLDWELQFRVTYT